MMNKQAYAHIVGLALDKTAAVGVLRRLSRWVKPVGKWMGKAYDEFFPVDTALGRRSRRGLNAPVRNAIQDARSALSDDHVAAWKLHEQVAEKLPAKYRPIVIKTNNKLVNGTLQESKDAYNTMAKHIQTVRNNPDKYHGYANGRDRYSWWLEEDFYNRLPTAARQIYARHNVGREFYKRPSSKVWHNYIKPPLVVGGIGTGIYGLGKFVYDTVNDPQYTE